MTTRSAPCESEVPHSIRRRVGTGVMVAAGIVIFCLVIWLAFSLGFNRLRADLDVEMKTALETTPKVQFDGADQGWELMNPDAEGEAPQYLNVTEREDMPCIFSWEAGRYDTDIVDVPNDLNDKRASEFIVAQLGYTGVDLAAVQIETTGELTVELIYAQQIMENGVTVASAVRAFTGSHHYVAFFLTCDDESALNPSLMMSVFDDTMLDIAPAD